MKIKKPSVREQIIAFAKEQHGLGFKAIDFKGIAPMAQVYVMLGKLKKQGILKHNAKKKVYTFVPYPGTQPLPEKPKLDPARENDAKTIQYLIEEQNRLHSELAATDEKYDDALAVIRYLEDKLIKTIQYTAKQGGNV